MSKTKIALLIVIPLALLYVSLFLGRYPISPGDVIQVFLSQVLPINHDWSTQVETVLMNIRLPRVLVAMLIGAGLSISGAAYQGMFRNPLVSPDILGVSAASGFGAALAILVSDNLAMVQISAFLFGGLGVVLTYLISRVYKTTPILMLVLSGVVVAAFFASLISVTKFVADPYSKLPAITFWLMGSLSSVTPKDVFVVLPPMLIGGTGLIIVGWQINVLAMGDEEARSLGIRTELLKGVVIVCTTMMTSSAVCVAGMVGWIGLVVPHIARMIVGPDHKVLLPTSLAIGATYMLIVDNIARVATATEIPLGILTAMIGAPFFAYLLRKTKGGWK